MIGYRDQLAGAVAAAAVTSPTSYSWFGRRSRPLSPDVTAALAPRRTREYLIQGLRRELYRSFYSQGRPVPLSSHRYVPAALDHAFAASLARANAGCGRWEPGWRVVSLDDGMVGLARDGLRVRARAADCRGACAVGSTVDVRRPKEAAGGSTGFFLALGDAEPELPVDQLEVRVYFNVASAGAAPLVAACTSLLNEAEVPFNLKVADRPGGFFRCDPAVLYLDGGGFERARDLMPAIVSSCAPHLRKDLPALTKPLGFGVAGGEHVADLGGSFGTSRCGLVAEGIVAAHERGARALSDRVAAVAERFAADGLDIDVPYLAPGSVDLYEP